MMGGTVRGTPKPIANLFKMPKPSTPQSASDPDRTARFVQLFAQHNRRLYALIRVLVSGATDAEDVFQNTSTVLWAKFDQFTEGTDFWRWASQVARYEALAWRRKCAMSSKIFSDRFYEVIEVRAAELGTETNERLIALAECVDEMDEPQRALVEARYQPGATTRDVADQFDRSPNAICKALKRAHEWLFDCVEGKLDEPTRKEDGS